jgi:hypothetical protein
MWEKSHITLSMTDAQLATRIAEASLIKQAEEEAKLRPTPYPFVEPVEITKRCIVTGKKHIITVEKKGWEEYTSGTSLRPLSECLPMLTEEQEQLLISSISDLGFEHMFGVARAEYDHDEAFD